MTAGERGLGRWHMAGLFLWRNVAAVLITLTGSQILLHAPILILNINELTTAHDCQQVTEVCWNCTALAAARAVATAVLGSVA